MNAAKILLPLLLLAAAGGGAYYLLEGHEAPPAPRSVTPPPEVQTPEVQQPAVAPSATVEPSEEPVGRTALDLSNRADADAPQGVRGRVLLPNGAPAEGVPIYLMKSLASDPIGTWLANRSGRLIPPVAQMVTGSDGSFALGVRKLEDTYDVRVVPSKYPELDHRGIKLDSGDWYDVHDLRLEVGALVQGRVSDEVTGGAVANAVVYLNSTNQSHEMLAAPGREKGIAVEVDAAGNFRIDCAPREGTITLAAEADGYARLEKTNVTIQADQVNEINLELARGMPISGIVQDQKGVAIANATVIATAISNKVPQTGQAVTDRDGHFQIAALREGPYQLVASAKMYAEKTEKPILAGEDKVQLVLEQQGSAKVRVLDKQGRPIKVFTLGLKRSFPGNPVGIGNVPEFRDARIMPPDFQGDFALIRGIPNGDFVFQITADKFARTLSEPFHVIAGDEIPEVTVGLTLGGVLTGRVIDDRGNPVAGATVSTDINGGFASDSDFFKILGQFMPEKITKTSVRADGQGRYRLSLLAYGDYMVRAAHPDFCEGSAIELKIDGETDVTVPDIVMSRGAIVEGITTVGGQPAGQVKITVGPPPSQTAELDAQGKPKMMFMAYAISDSDGHYRLLKRVPPGTYQIHANRQAGSNNPFEALLDMKQTERELIVPAGQDRIIQNFNIPGQ